MQISNLGKTVLKVCRSCLGMLRSNIHIAGIQKDNEIQLKKPPCHCEPAALRMDLVPAENM